MNRSLGLAAYLALARRGGQAGPVPESPRPEGRVIWAHAVDAGRARALAGLARQLQQHRPDIAMVMTVSDDGAETAAEARGPRGPAIRVPLPPDTIPAAEAFLQHWRPDLCLWSGGALQPALLICAAREGVPLCLVDAEEALLERSRWPWLRDLPRAVLAEFIEIHTRDEAAARQARRMGADPARVQVTGALQEEALTLPCREADLEEMSRLMRARPVWLAAMVQPEEIDTVLGAHREASRAAHRCVLIVVPDDPEQSDAMAERITAQGWRYIRWSKGMLPDEATQVILADTHGEMGLWYRLAPVSFMGSSLVSGQYGRDPDEPAAHGSAILYGPNVARYLDRYSRYAEAGAARIVRDTDTLAAAVQALLPPDSAAAMAHAAWEVASRGAAVTDRVVEMVLDALDRRAAAAS
ncbi:MAG: glycosyltransferase N-terminal domain-containing protein [Roseovarius sp.]|nr:glycosyltransferase N-terminal domain-containing protein [Roseovarius sp.]